MHGGLWILLRCLWNNIFHQMYRNRPSANLSDKALIELLLYTHTIINTYFQWSRLGLVMCYLVGMRLYPWTIQLWQYEDLSPDGHLQSLQAVPRSAYTHNKPAMNITYTLSYIEIVNNINNFFISIKVKYK